MQITPAVFQGREFWAEADGDQVRLYGFELTTWAQVPAQEVSLLPAMRPGKIICVGLNYHAHAREMNKSLPAEPLLFFKPPSAVIGPQAPIHLPRQSAEVHYEGELAVVMGRLCRACSEAEAMQYVLGFTCANDVTARDLQQKDGLYARAKGFDSFCPLGARVETGVQDLPDRILRTVVNEDVVQQGQVSDMIFSVPALISFISQVMTLHPGDVLLTGTPPGVGRLDPGDNVRVEIEGIGSLSNPVSG